MGFVDKAKLHLRDVVVGVIADPRTEAALQRIVAQVVLPILPVAIGAAVDRVADRLTDLDQDGQTDVAEVVDAAKASIDKLLPPGVVLPVIGEIDLGKWIGGFFPDLNRPK